MLSDETAEVRLARIETKLDGIAERLVEDHETRLRALERWRYALPVTLMFAVASIAVSIAAVFTRLGIG